MTGHGGDMTGSDVVHSGTGAMRGYGTSGGTGKQSANLGDILERVLDKGLVIAGDIKVNLLDIELLTIKLRLVIASLDTAREVGINWWEADPWLSADAIREARADDGQQAPGGRKGGSLQSENRRLRARIRELESSQGDRDE
jgi:hypothetical protein